VSRRGADPRAPGALDRGPRARRPRDLRSRAEGSIDDANNFGARADAPGGAGSDYRSNPRAVPVPLTGRRSSSIEPVMAPTTRNAWGPPLATPPNQLPRWERESHTYGIGTSILPRLKPQGVWTREKKRPTSGEAGLSVKRVVGGTNSASTRDRRRGSVDLETKPKPGRRAARFRNFAISFRHVVDPESAASRSNLMHGPDQVCRDRSPHASLSDKTHSHFDRPSIDDGRPTQRALRLGAKRPSQCFRSLGGVAYDTLASARTADPLENSANMNANMIVAASIMITCTTVSSYIGHHARCPVPDLNNRPISWPNPHQSSQFSCVRGRALSLRW